MAYINVYVWKSEEVLEWLKGLECINGSYIKAFANNQIDGRQLLGIRPYELEELGITSVGHQEIILEAVEHLKKFHYDLDKENLQFLSMQVNTISTSLHKQLSYDPEAKLGTQILNDVAIAISKVKRLINWLDLNPFQGHTQYSEIRVQMLRLSLELATIAQRDRFAQDPILQITNLTQKLSKLSDYIVQDITDPLILQPAYLDLVTLKKRESELGFYIMPSYQFIHRVTDIKYNSPAHNSGKVEEGDEIVQINYQTVVGWQYKKVLLQLQESATDVLLTLKKRPKHTKIYGQLGLIKLPSKKRSIPYRWDNLPSPRVELFNMPDLLIPTSQAIKKEVVSDIEDSSGNESETPNETKSSEKELRLYMPKPRAAVLQRRHTICGDDLTNFQNNIGNMVLWHNRKINKDILDSPSLRDKSVSFGFGLDHQQQRPTTCLGISENISANRLKTSLPSMMGTLKQKETIQECDEKQESQSNCNISTGVSKVVRFDSNKSLDYNHDPKYICNIEDTIIESFMPIPYVDEEEIAPDNIVPDNFVQEIFKKIEPPKPAPRTNFDSKSSDQYVEAINTIVVNREIVKRGRLDKSHSTPTYDSDLPPAIEPRQQTVKIPPAIPPRKPTNTFVKIHADVTESNDENKSKVANVIDLKSIKTVEHQLPSPIKKSPSINSLTKTISMSVTTIPESEESELLMPAKVKTLTNKKKNSLMAKRRKISLKSLGTSTTIQGHLYRRAKDRSEVAYWSKLYFVLIETALYGFKNKEAQKADCVIFLSGFTVSLAKEVHSKSNAFKVYHPKKTLYLAAETERALAQWMEYIRQATLKGTTNLECEPKELFSETECSDDDFDILLNKQLSTPSPMKINQEKATSSEQTPPSKHYHLNFGSLKKFARGSNTSPSANSGDNSSPSDHKFLAFFTTSKSAEKKSADIIQTPQFKTYKKVKDHNGGLQLGATSMINSTVSDMYLQSGADNSSILSGFTIDPRKKIEDPIQVEAIIEHEIYKKPPMPECNEHEKYEKSSKQSNKKSLNYLHASNPNLLDFNFHSTDFDFPTSNISPCNWDHQTTGMTLLDLMQKQLDEEKKDMYNKRVEQGIEKAEERTLQKVMKPAIPPKPADPHIEKIQKRTLPVTPDYAQSFKPDDKAILYTRTKEGQKLRDFGYELINGDDSTTNATLESAKGNDKIRTAKRGGDRIFPMSGSLKKKSGFTWMMSHDKEDFPSATTNCLGNNAGSFRKSKNKIDNFKGQPIAAPFAYDKNLQQSMNSSKVLRKNSAPNSSAAIFSNLLFSSSSCKEKKLLGSPKLHRAIFGRTHSNSSSGSNVDHEIFSPITFPSRISRHGSDSRRTDSENSPEVSSTSSFPIQQNYPELQSTLPPIFKSEVYSLNVLKKA